MNRNRARTSGLCRAAVLFAAAGLFACSSQGSGTAPGDSVLVNGAQHVVWSNLGGGFGPPIPASAGSG